MRKNNKKILIAGIGVLFVVAIIAANLSTLKNSLNNLSFFRPPTPTPFKYSKYPIPPALPTGTQIYNVSRGSGSKGPNISRVTFAPIDPAKGTVQKISVKVVNTVALKTVTVYLYTDYQTKTYEAKLTEGKNTDGTWVAEVPVEDSFTYVYRVMVEAMDDKEQSSVTLTIR